MQQESPWLTTKEAAQRLRCAPRTLELWRKKGIGPIWKRLGESSRSTIIYHKDDIDRWVSQRTGPQTSRYDCHFMKRTINEHG